MDGISNDDESFKGKNSAAWRCHIVIASTPSTN